METDEERWQMLLRQTEILKKRFGVDSVSEIPVVVSEDAKEDKCTS